jgi:transposase-like protein
MKSDWLQHVKAWRESGLSQAQYCRQYGVNPNTLSGWIRRESRLNMNDPLKVIPIQITRLEPVADLAQTSLVLRFSQGIQLEFSSALRPCWLAELLRCL